MEKYRPKLERPTGKRKLTLKRAEELRAEYSEGHISVNSLAQREGVSYVTMKWLLEGKRYRVEDSERVVLTLEGPLLEALREEAKASRTDLASCAMGAVRAFLGLDRPASDPEQTAPGVAKVTGPCRLCGKLIFRGNEFFWTDYEGGRCHPFCRARSAPKALPPKRAGRRNPHTLEAQMMDDLEGRRIK